MGERPPGSPGGPGISSSGIGKRKQRVPTPSASQRAGPSWKTSSTADEEMEDELADSGTDARIDVDGNAMISFIRGEELGSPEVGPSRLSPTTRSSSVDPFNFFPARSDPPVITQSHSNATTFNVAKDSSTIPSDLGTPNVGSPSASRAASTSPIPDIAPAVAEHFDPPPLFSKSLHTALDTRPNSSTGAKLTTGLLLPGNVTVEGDENDESDGRPAPVEGVHFVDDSSQRGVQRYFVEKQTEEEAFLASANSSKICQNCHRPGHRAQDCPHVICVLCGAEDEHLRKDCPHGLVCFGCGGRGHRQSECPDPVSRHSRRKGCARCGSGDHPDTACPSLWRVYSYYSVVQREAALEKRRKLTGWYKEAAGGEIDDLFCYNCAGSGHLGDDCPQGRASGAKRLGPTAFSYEMASRGPFRRSTTRPGASHMRFDDDENDYQALPGTAPGFQGESVGKRTREKATRRLQEQENGAEAADEDDWFGNRNRSTPLSMRGRGGGRGGTPYGGRGRGGFGGSNTPTNRPWQSEPRRIVNGSAPHTPQSGSPFSHAHLMGNSNSISFGTLSTPGSSRSVPTMPNSTRRERREAKGMSDRPDTLLKKVLGKGGQAGSHGAKSDSAVTPEQGSSKKSKGKDNDKSKKRARQPDVAPLPEPASTPTTGKKQKQKYVAGKPPKTPSADSSRANSVASALDVDASGNKGLSKKQKKRKREAEESLDLEQMWYQSGKGGGNVAKWGDDMPGPSKKSSGSGGGAAKPKKASKGQQYMGGY